MSNNKLFYFRAIQKYLDGYTETIDTAIEEANKQGEDNPKTARLMALTSVNAMLEDLIQVKHDFENLSIKKLHEKYQ